MRCNALKALILCSGRRGKLSWVELSDMLSQIVQPLLMKGVNLLMIQQAPWQTKISLLSTSLLQFPTAEDVIFKVKDIRLIPSVCPDPKDQRVVGCQVKVIADEAKVNEGGGVGDTLVGGPT